MQSRNFKLRPSCALLIGFFMLVAGVVMAQDADDDSASRALDEIIVTATLRERNLRTVPVSVSVVTEQDLRAIGATAFADYARTVPGLTFTDGGTGGEKQVIRGVSNNPWSETNSPTAVHLDDVPFANAGGVVGPPFNPDPALIDINRVEVLRGPQGTLFGAGSMGGAIRIVTNQPDFEASFFELDTTMTSTEHGETGYGISAIFNAPLVSETAALRGVIYRSDLGGFIDNVQSGRDDVNNREITGARLAGRFAVSDRTSVTAKVSWQDRESDGFSHEDPNIGRRQQSRFGESIADEWINYKLSLDVDLGAGRLTSLTSYLDREVGTTPDISFFMGVIFGLDIPLNAINKEAVGEFVQEIHYVSDGDGPFNWIAGLFYQDHDQDISQDFPAPGFDALTGGLASIFGPPDNLFVRRETFSLQQVAVYGEVSYAFTPRLELTAGGRWYDIDRDYTADNRGLLFVMGTLQESQSAGDNGVIPRLSLNYTVSDAWSAYAAVAEGFRPGGINPGGTLASPPCVAELQALGFTSSPTSYESDSLTSYELGTRYQSPAGRLRLSAAAYSIDWSDMQTMKFLNCGSGFIENAGEAESTGIEFELQATPLDRLELAFAASFTDAELSENVPNLNGSRGDRVPGVARVTARASARLLFAALANRNAYAQLDLQHVGDSRMEFAPSSPQIPSYTIANLRFGVDRDSWSAAVFVNNVADEDSALFVNDNPLGSWVSPLRPRTVGLNLNWRF